MSGTRFRVVHAASGAILSDLPSPMLIQAGGGDAWNPDGGRFWRLREDRYDPPGTQYTRVRIVHTEDYAIDVHVTVIEDGHEDEPVEYDDTFHVVAADSAEATARVMEKAAEDIESRFGEDCSHGVMVKKVRRGDLW